MVLCMFISCIPSEKVSLTENDSVSVYSDKDSVITIVNKNPPLDELEGEDEQMALEKFKPWKGKYHFVNAIHDGYGRESIVVVNLELIRPDSSTIEFWLADEKLSKYVENNNYFKILGGVYGGYGKENDSIFFHYNRVMAGKLENPASPVFTLFKYNNKYAIQSVFTSPPHNGEIEMPIIKIK